MNRVLAAFVVVLTAIAGSAAFQTGQTAAPDGVARQLMFLAGSWGSSDDTELGHAEAITSFTAGVAGQVLERRNAVKYTSGKAAGTQHEDLLVVYAEVEPSGPRLRGLYLDNEGHVIRYLVSVPSANTAVFESDGSQAGPRYRLTHTVSGNELKTTFEIAAPGQPYKTYVSGTSIRRRD